MRRGMRTSTVCVSAGVRSDQSNTGREGRSGGAAATGGAGAAGGAAAVANPSTASVPAARWPSPALSSLAPSASAPARALAAGAPPRPFADVAESPSGEAPCEGGTDVSLVVVVATFIASLMQSGSRSAPPDSVRRARAMRTRFRPGRSRPAACMVHARLYCGPRLAAAAHRAGRRAVRPRVGVRLPFPPAPARVRACARAHGAARTRANCAYTHKHKHRAHALHARSHRHDTLSRSGALFFASGTCALGTLSNVKSSRGLDCPGAGTASSTTGAPCFLTRFTMTAVPLERLGAQRLAPLHQRLALGPNLVALGLANFSVRVRLGVAHPNPNPNPNLAHGVDVEAVHPLE